jgi:hypothetical protein
VHHSGNLEAIKLLSDAITVLPPENVKSLGHKLHTFFILAYAQIKIHEY